MDSGSGPDSYIAVSDFLIQSTGVLTMMMFLAFSLGVVKSELPRNAARDGAQEYYTRVDVDLLRKGSAGDGAGSFGAGESALYVTVKKDGTFALTSQRGETEVLRTEGDLSARLRSARPSKLYMRVDRMAPFGAAESVILEAQKAGIAAFMAAREEG